MPVHGCSTTNVFPLVSRRAPSPFTYMSRVVFGGGDHRDANPRVAVKARRKEVEEEEGNDILGYPRTRRIAENATLFSDEVSVYACAQLCLPIFRASV